jgi:hypothetical protein
LALDLNEGQVGHAKVVTRPYHKRGRGLRRKNRKPWGLAFHYIGHVFDTIVPKFWQSRVILVNTRRLLHQFGTKNRQEAYIHEAS